MLATLVRFSLGSLVFYKFTNATREMLKYILVFEKEEGGEIRPSTFLFHARKKEIRDRTCILRATSFVVFLIMALFFTKNVVEVYRVLFKDHVSYQAELG